MTRLLHDADVLRRGDLVHRDPVGAHPAQKKRDAGRLWAACQHIRVRSHVKLRSAMQAGGKLTALVHDANALPSVGEPPHAVAKQRRFTGAGASEYQS